MKSSIGVASPKSSTCQAVVGRDFMLFLNRTWPYLLGTKWAFLVTSVTIFSTVRFESLYLAGRGIAVRYAFCVWLRIRLQSLGEGSIIRPETNGVATAKTPCASIFSQILTS